MGSEVNEGTAFVATETCALTVERKLFAIFATASCISNPSETVGFLSSQINSFPVVEVKIA